MALVHELLQLADDGLRGKSHEADERRAGQRVQGQASGGDMPDPLKRRQKGQDYLAGAFELAIRSAAKFDLHNLSPPRLIDRADSFNHSIPSQFEGSFLKSARLFSRKPKP